MKEIEMKFLVKEENNIKEISYESQEIKQGYICDDPERTVRVRLINNHRGFLTIKGKSKIIDGKDSRLEIEKEITKEEAESLFILCKNFIHKIRHKIKSKEGFVWEVDFFLGKNEGLILAEIELPEEFNINELNYPKWIKENVTGNPEYYNSNLSK